MTKEEDVESSPIKSLPAPVKARPKQFSAMWKKNASLQWRQWKTNLCLILFPLVMFALIAILQAVFESLYPPAGADIALTAPIKLNQYSGSSPTNIIFGYHPDFYYIDPNGVAGYALPNGTKAGFLGNMQQRVADNVSYPYFTKFPSKTAVDDQLRLDIGDARAQIRALRTSDNLSPVYPIVSGGYEFASLNTSAAPSLEVVIQYNNFSSSWPCKLVAPAGLQSFCSLWGAWMMAAQQNLMSSNLMTVAFGKQIVTTFTAVPTIRKSISVRVGELLVGLFVPVTLMFLAPVFVYNIVIEKQERLRELMKMMGLEMKYYWSVTWVFNVLYYWLILAVFLIIGYLFGAVGNYITFFKDTNYGIILAICVGWGFAQIGLSFTLSAFLNKATTSRVLAYSLILATWLCGFVVEGFIIPSNGNNQISAVYLLWPPFALYHALYQCFNACASGRCLESAVGEAELRRSLAFIWLEGFFYLILGLYLDAVLPREYGVPEPPLFFLKPITRLFKKKDPAQQVEMHTINVEEKKEEVEVDSDVLEEEYRVEHNVGQEDSQVVIRNLSKTYPNGKRALKKLSLGVKSGECFGMLGMNGAGKSTSIHIICGLYEPTGGTAIVCGNDIRTNIHDVHLLLGVCPQFDIIWSEMTCREHLLLYSRLKGIQNEDQHVNNFLKYVGLTQHAEKLAGQLSGGMKRRLSIAMSLVGDPKIVFLDEPTTGLDPQTRRQLWDLIIRSKPGRSIMLTTHSMEEAECLCDRIGVMHHGRMRCVGSQLRLKNKFGEGFKLTVTYDEANKETAMSLVKQLVPTYAVGTSFVGSQSVQIPPNVIKLSKLFSELEKNKDKYGIRDFGISQTSLEDVFLRIAKVDDSNMNALEGVKKGCCATLCCCCCR